MPAAPRISSVSTSRSVSSCGPQRYSATVKACLHDRNVDGMLAILTPQAMTDPVAVARELVRIGKDSCKTMLACFMGEEDVAEARHMLEQGRIPAYETPEDAVRSFLNMYEYQRNLKLLSETPATIPHGFTPKTGLNRKIINAVARSGRFILTAPETREILANYQIPVPKGALAKNPEQARALGTGRLSRPSRETLR